MNQVFKKIGERLDQAIADSEKRWTGQLAELQRYEAEIQEAEDAAEQALTVGNMQAYREQSRKAIEARAASERLRELVEAGKKPALTEKQYEEMYNAVKAEMDKLNAAGIKKVYEHLADARQEAEKLLESLQQGAAVIKRMQFYGRGESENFNIRLMFAPDIQHCIAELRKLGFIRMYEYLTTGKW